MKKYFLSPVILVVLVLFLGSCSGKGETETSDLPVSEMTGIHINPEQFAISEMKLGRVEETTFKRSVKVNGYVTVPPQGKVSIGTIIPGKISLSSLAPGTKVKAGDPLFTISGLELIQLQQDYLDAEAKLGALKEDYERQKELSGQQVSSRKIFLASESAYLSELARYKGLRAKLSLLGISSPSDEKMEIRKEIAILAPIDAYVLSVNVVNGQYMEPGGTLVELIDPSRLRLELIVYGKDIMNVEKGMPVVFYNPDDRDRKYNAELTLLGKSLDPASNSALCTATIAQDNAGTFINGMFVEAEIILQERKVKAVPDEAILKADEDFYLLKLIERDESGYRFEKVQIIPGEEYNSFRELIGSEVNDSILVNGVYNIMIE